MKKFLFTVAMAILAFTGASAQEDRPEQLTQEQRTAKHVQMLSEKLSLTDDQKSQLTTLFTEFDSQRTKKAKQSKEEMDEFEAKVLAVLTTEQQATYKQMMSERKNPPCHDMGDHRGGPAPKEMAEARLKQLDDKLSLTADQKSKIKTLLDNHDKQMQAQNNSKQKPDPETMKSTMQKLESDISAVLTSEQQATYKQMLKEEAAARQNGRPERPKGKK